MSIIIKILFSFILVFLINNCSSPNMVQEKNISVKAVLKKDDGSVKPILARTFIFSSIPFLKYREESEREAGFKPLLYNFPAECKPFAEPCTYDYEKYESKLNSWNSEVEKIYYNKVKDLNNKQISFTTNLSGESMIDIPIGTWYLSGTYEDNSKKLFWEELRFDIIETDVLIIIDNKNATKTFDKKL